MKACLCPSCKFLKIGQVHEPSSSVGCGMPWFIHLGLCQLHLKSLIVLIQGCQKRPQEEQRLWLWCRLWQWLQGQERCEEGQRQQKQWEEEVWLWLWCNYKDKKWLWQCKWQSQCKWPEGQFKKRLWLWQHQWPQGQSKKRLWLWQQQWP